MTSMSSIPGAAPNTPQPEPVLPELGDEELEVRRRRYKEARLAGMSVVEAQLWSEAGGDVGLLRLMVKAGATPEQMARVLL